MLAIATWRPADAARHLRLRVAPVCDSHVHEDLGIGLWERPVYGFDFSRILETEVQSFITAACDLKPSSLLGPAVTVLDLDLDNEHGRLLLHLGGEHGRRAGGHVHGFGGWFEVDLADGVSSFPDASDPLAPVLLPCAPVPGRARRSDPLRHEGSARGGRRPATAVYFIDGEVLRDDRVVHRFFYRHHGSFEGPAERSRRPASPIVLFLQFGVAEAGEPLGLLAVEPDGAGRLGASARSSPKTSAAARASSPPPPRRSSRSAGRRSGRRASGVRGSRRDELPARVAPRRLALPASQTGASRQPRAGSPR